MSINSVQFLIFDLQTQVKCKSYLHFERVILLKNVTGVRRLLSKDIPMIQNSKPQSRGSLWKKKHSILPLQNTFPAWHIPTWHGTFVASWQIASSLSCCWWTIWLGFKGQNDLSAGSGFQCSSPPSKPNRKPKRPSVGFFSPSLLSRRVIYLDHVPRSTIEIFLRVEMYGLDCRVWRTSHLQAVPASSDSVAFLSIRTMKKLKLRIVHLELRALLEDTTVATGARVEPEIFSLLFQHMNH